MVELVAEVGSNWNGNDTTAWDLIHTAAECGADTIKFQHYPDERYGPYPMTELQLMKFQLGARSVGIEFLCSVFDQRTLDEYVALGDHPQCVTPSRVKIASPELTHHDLLRSCAAAGLEIILSTGMSTPEQIEEAVVAIEPRGLPLTLLHCVSSYPAPPEEMNLRAMTKLNSYGYGIKVGLSDHSVNPTVAPVMATVLGAVMIEKHFTLDTMQPGPDHAYALDPQRFQNMARTVRLAEQMMGDGQKRIMPSEDPTDRRTAEFRPSGNVTIQGTRAWCK